MPSSSHAEHRSTCSVLSWTRLSYGYGLLVAFGLGYGVWAIPIQVTDSLGPLLAVNQRSLEDLLFSTVHEVGYFRPMRWINIWWVFEASNGHYALWFRGWHVAQVFVLVMLFVRLVRPSTPVGAATVPLGLAVLLGMHTFPGLVNEAFPINHFLTVAVCCLAAAELTQGSPRWWRSVGACLLFAFASLTLESGITVGIVVIAARAAGARGVSRNGALTIGALMIGYAYLRFWLVQTGLPGLTERSSGFGFTTLDPDELVTRFGDTPWLFYVYNVVTSVMSVLFSEPRAGQFDFVRRARNFELQSADVTALAAYLMSTGVIAWYVWQRRGEWRLWRFRRDDQLVVVFMAVTLTNGLISYAYQKDVILSPSGVFFALAVTVAARQLLETVPVGLNRRWCLIACGCLLVSLNWSARAANLHGSLGVAATQTRNEWAYLDQWVERGGQGPTSPSESRLTRALQAEAIERHPERLRLGSPWAWSED